ncbi:fungal specific transcription factor domain-containing protein [Aspergillus puulaauensis]|uniref:Xylanolytic transcriptional activator regulatory domain-containing protein n=1 Tax=Aspergillus puulaauensis TaxID=1220207 RepID=A0A7R7XR58_9EURO|nr:uncharacterized protein APUU_50154A [Aspergillus puulaauensis]BCS25443.1 hypothetical protein APUU_50154A [Aspergillus puulaauensis]
MTKADTRALQNEICILRQLVAERELPAQTQSQLGLGVAVQTPASGGDLLESSDSGVTALRQGSNGLPVSHHRRASYDTARGTGYGSSPQDVYIAGTVTEDGAVQAYGVTSTLHEPATVMPQGTHWSPTAMEDEEEKRARTQVVRDQLIANAAIQRQKETSLDLTPQVKQRVDLDGLEPQMAFHLLNLHWNRQHYSYLLTYRPAIMESIIDGGPYVNKLLLNAIYYSTSLYCDGVDLRVDCDDMNSRGGRFYQRFKGLLVQEIDQPSLPTAVALLLCGASLVSHGKQSAGWVLSGTAYRMIIDLGCHLSIDEAHRHSSGGSDMAPSRITAIEFEMRKRVYWGAFMTDKFQSLYLGRAPALRSTDVQPPTELLDSYEEMELWEPYRGLDDSSGDQAVYQPRLSYAISTFASLLRLAEIANQIIEAFYSKDSMHTATDELREMKTTINTQLDDWERSLPSHLHFDPGTDPTPPAHQITPHTTYWTLKILLERPFLNTGHLNFILDPTTQSNGEEKCTTAAVKIYGFVKAYHQSFTLRRAPYLLCYAIYSAVLVILRQTRQDRARFSECIPFFWSALIELQQGCNAGLKKPLSILKALMTRLGEDIPGLYRSVRERSRAGLHGADGADGEEATVDDIHFLSQGYAGETLNSELLQSLDLDFINSEQWFNTVGDEGLLDDSMYGLFTS